MSECEICNASMDYCEECDTCHKCLGEDIGGQLSAITELQSDLQRHMEALNTIGSLAIPWFSYDAQPHMQLNSVSAIYAMFDSDGNYIWPIETGEEK